MKFFLKNRIFNVSALHRVFFVKTWFWTFSALEWIFLHPKNLKIIWLTKEFLLIFAIFGKSWKKESKFGRFSKNFFRMRIPNYEIPILALFAMRSPCWTGRISLKFYEIPPEKKGGSHKYIRKSEHMLYFRWKKKWTKFFWFLANFVHFGENEPKFGRI